MDEKRFNEVLRSAIEKEIGSHNLYAMFEQVQAKGIERESAEQGVHHVLDYRNPDHFEEALKLTDLVVWTSLWNCSRM